MSIVFYDQQGNAVAYSEDAEHVYTFAGRAVAYLRDGSVYGFSGAHLGRFEAGLVRDNRGAVVFFTDEARGWLVKPVKKIKPLKGPKQLLPAKARAAPKPLKPVDCIAWSPASGESFFP
jgi:hypothetical protein